eukprot:CAMPEP_0185577510 /NCGR_PEP_ID=MMETSP0434-20130131/10396_1 /TAXON_ID=626734 ORGANISM="Favella taraikaensis, Strain Fe Narragansett Bay" /NCGR_SAMPLE_ID=MMETSP0434 /ASSEMBLY_ACC=CAM_ASM_000379 /LENGTH=104 /DNA_ID=CAMNT_0028195105 /DNA_START=133 /DNA_END=447 /DNA_ORIENTATION=+
MKAKGSLSGNLVDHGEHLDEGGLDVREELFLGDLAVLVGVEGLEQDGEHVALVGRFQLSLCLFPVDHTVRVRVNLLEEGTEMGSGAFALLLHLGFELGGESLLV